MSTFALRVFAGPCGVKDVAETLRQAGLDVSCEGTEHVFLNAEGSTPEGAAWNASVDVFRFHGRDFGLHFKPLSGPFVLARF